MTPAESVLLERARDDARRQLFVARRSARNYARAQQCDEQGPVERAEINWREMNPGLSALLDHRPADDRPRPGPHNHRKDDHR